MDLSLDAGEQAVHVKYINAVEAQALPPNIRSIPRHDEGFLRYSRHDPHRSILRRSADPRRHTSSHRQPLRSVSPCIFPDPGPACQELAVILTCTSCRPRSCARTSKRRPDRLPPRRLTWRRLAVRPHALQHHRGRQSRPNQTLRPLHHR